MTSSRSVLCLLLASSLGAQEPDAAALLRRELREPGSYSVLNTMSPTG